MELSPQERRKRAKVKSRELCKKSGYRRRDIVLHESRIDELKSICTVFDVPACQILDRLIVAGYLSPTRIINFLKEKSKKGENDDIGGRADYEQEF